MKINNTNILILVCVFILFAFLGYLAAARILPSSSVRIPSQSVDSVEESIQNNYLLFHVDDMIGKKPQLISVWAVFVYQTNSPQLMFLPLYPSLDHEINSKFLNIFKLDQNGQVNSRFLNQISKTYDIPITGYILSDDTGMGYSNLWLTGQQVSYVPSIAAVSDELVKTVRIKGEGLYQQFCQLASSGSANSYLSNINWTQLLPDHFSTDLSFSSLTLIKDQLSQASAIRCEVLTGNSRSSN